MNLKQILIALGVLFIGVGIYVFIKNQSRVQFVGGIEVPLPEYEYLNVTFSKGETLRFRKSTLRDSQSNDINSHGIDISSNVRTTTYNLDGTETKTDSSVERNRQIKEIQKSISKELVLSQDSKFLQAPFDEERVLEESENIIKVLLSNKLGEGQRRQYYSLKLEKGTGTALELLEVY